MLNVNYQLKLILLIKQLSFKILLKKDLNDNIGVEVNKVIVNISKIEAKEVVRETKTIKETPDITNDEVSDDTEVSN